MVVKYNRRSMELAIRAAEASRDADEMARPYYCGAAIFHRKKGVIALQHNSPKTHPAFSKKVKYTSLHAEARCILHSGYQGCQGTTLYVARVTRAPGKRFMARPCERICLPLILASGIRHVFYTYDSDQYGYMTIDKGTILYEHLYLYPDVDTIREEISKSNPKQRKKRYAVA